MSVFPYVWDRDFTKPANGFWQFFQNIKNFVLFEIQNRLLIFNFHENRMNPSVPSLSHPFTIHIQAYLMEGGGGARAGGTRRGGHRRRWHLPASCSLPPSASEVDVKAQIQEIKQEKQKNKNTEIQEIRVAWVIPLKKLSRGQRIRITPNPLSALYSPYDMFLGPY